MMQINERKKHNIFLKKNNFAVRKKNMNCSKKLTISYSISNPVPELILDFFFLHWDFITLDTSKSEL